MFQMTEHQVDKFEYPIFFVILKHGFLVLLFVSFRSYDFDWYVDELKLIILDGFRRWSSL